MIISYMCEYVGGAVAPEDKPSTEGSLVSNEMIVIIFLGPLGSATEKG